MNSDKTIIWNNKDKNKLFDYPDDTNLSFSPASHANKNAVKHLMNTATRCNVVVKPTNCISTHKWNQNSSHVSTTTKEHAIRAAQTKRIGDHHQIAFCEWLIQPNNFSNSGQEIFTPINMAGTPAGGFIRKEYNTSRGGDKKRDIFLITIRAQPHPSIFKILQPKILGFSQEIGPQCVLLHIWGLTHFLKEIQGFLHPKWHRYY